MKRDKKDTEFATDEPTKQSNIKEPIERAGCAEPPRPKHEEDLIINEKKSKSTSL
ncbi:hypothetical protein ABIA69_004524 [Lysinibacillus parviboronicapiens]|uniref:3-methyladenine DNA glycosylase n=1 Tax=Lysinibacillus parviboronicapiens TaxID=436516 RepID=A0ABV2PQW1_9BACI|nr:hypothetical protein [Lysinibacillus parviboronicapiens]